LKELWVEIDPTSQEKEKIERIAAATSDVLLENNKATIVTTKTEIEILTNFNEDEINRLKRKGRKIALRVTIQGKEDENTAAKAAELQTDYIIIKCLNWRVIPLENLIAETRGKSKLIAEVTTANEAKLVIEALELGTDGVLLKTSNPEELTKTVETVKKQTFQLELKTAKIISTKQIGTGARVCVDTCDLMDPGEGLLVGSQSAGLFLVEAEVHENPYVASRPFRVNAGSVSMYTLGSLQATRYLSELKAGDEVLIVNKQGNTRLTNVGRTKTEFRPLLLIEALIDGNKIKTVLQNAETIRLVTAENSKPVTQLNPGDEVLVHIAGKGGRHFGISVPEERVIEH
jgi:3-dehydroquinate synthase II